MATPLEAGKLPPELLTALLRRLPPPPGDVLLGPALGEDACALGVPAGVLIAATDPITFTSSEIGRYAVIVNSNDVAVMGARPRWFLAAVLLPIGTDQGVVESIFADLSETLAEVGASLVGGHTEITSAVTRPVIVGQMLGVPDHGRFVTSGGARPGEVVVQVGPAPVEGAAVLVSEGDRRLDQLDAEVVDRARRALIDPGISVVAPAMAAAGLGATALHDPTEGGLAAGLHELAMASGVGLVVDPGAVLWFEPGTAVCAALGADPWATIASGTLLATFPAGDPAVDSLVDLGHQAAVIGSVVDGSGVTDRTGRLIPLPPRDEVARLLG